jgi:hypothetical protein
VANVIVMQMNPTRIQSSPLLNVNDPVQIHLLVETALGDSKEYELLSPEEVDALKKQCQSLTQRIEQTRQNLAIQSKYRDAAISMARLYSPTERSGEKKHRVSLLGNRHSQNEHVREADVERQASERRCEELAQELWSLEKRLMDPQMRLLKHTAGILQMTHKGSSRTPRPSAMNQQGIPGSPESMYTYTNARSSVDQSIEEDLFDDRSLYRTFDRLDGLGLGGHRDSFESHGRKVSRSPNGEQTRELLRTKEQIEFAEGKLENANSRLRDIINKASPNVSGSFGRLPYMSAVDSEAEPGRLLELHLDYLEKGLTVIGDEQVNSRRSQEADSEIELTIVELNRNMRSLLLPFDPSLPEPPQPDGKSLKAQLLYMQQSMGTVETELERATSNKSKGSVQSEALEQMETVLEGLWDIIQSGEQDIQRRKQQRRQTRMENGIEGDESDYSGDDIAGTPESYSLQAFSTKVQWLYGQATSLKDQKNILQKQIKQQRELNNKSDATKDTELSKMESDLRDTQLSLQKVEGEAQDLQTQLMSVMEQLDKSRRESTQRSLEKAKKDSDESLALQQVHATLAERNEEIERLEDEIQELKDDQGMQNAELQARVAEAEAKSSGLQAQLVEAEARIKQLNAELEDAKKLEKLVEEKEKEVDEANMQIATLQTEVTIARAELDGAYGSRAQRAAEVAANPAIQKEIDDLMNSNMQLKSEIEALKTSGGGSSARLEELQRELSETIEEYEIMTKASIEWEKEREQLEREVDKLRDEREGLETRLSDERVKWLGMKSPTEGGQGVGVGSTSTAVLKNEFKKMMRDTRAENAKALKVRFYSLAILVYF